MRDHRERVVMSGGRRYYWYAGPFTDVIEAHDYLAAMYARGEISEADADDATIIKNLDLSARFGMIQCQGADRCPL
jgi:hypothetical protein